MSKSSKINGRRPHLAVTFREDFATTFGKAIRGDSKEYFPTLKSPRSARFPAELPGSIAMLQHYRYGCDVSAIIAGVPLNWLSKWMGHASLEVTAIYANALGAEERSIAERM